MKIAILDFHVLSNTSFLWFVMKTVHHLFTTLRQLILFKFLPRAQVLSSPRLDFRFPMPVSLQNNIQIQINFNWNLLSGCMLVVPVVSYTENYKNGFETTDIPVFQTTSQKSLVSIDEFHCTDDCSCLLSQLCRASHKSFKLCQSPTWAVWMPSVMFQIIRKRSLWDILRTHRSRIPWGSYSKANPITSIRTPHHQTRTNKISFLNDIRLYNNLVESCFDKCVAVGWGGVSWYVMSQCLFFADETGTLILQLITCSAAQSRYRSLHNLFYNWVCCKLSHVISASDIILCSPRVFDQKTLTQENLSALPSVLRSLWRWHRELDSEWQNIKQSKCSHSNRNNLLLRWM